MVSVELPAVPLFCTMPPPAVLFRLPMVWLKLFRLTVPVTPGVAVEPTSVTLAVAGNC